MRQYKISYDNFTDNLEANLFVQANAEEIKAGHRSAQAIEKILKAAELLDEVGMTVEADQLTKLLTILASDSADKDDELDALDGEILEVFEPDTIEIDE